MRAGGTTLAPGRPGLVAEDQDLVLPQRVDEAIVWRPAAGDHDREPADWSECFAVFVGGADPSHDERVPVAGRYQRRDQDVVFTPAFGFVAGQDYVVRARRAGGSMRSVEFLIPRVATAEHASVTAVYPSGDAVPENVLRFYLHFSVPMAPHLAADLVTLRDATGTADRAAFMVFKQELWNEDRTRLTVLVDPGRIKRSVATNLDLGPALVEGADYELTVAGGWPSADGSSVLPPFSKRFHVTGPLRERPEIGRWTRSTPRPATRDALVLGFDRPFDRHLLSDAIGVVTGDGRTIDGRTIEGQAHIVENETSWSFTPDEPWPTADIRIIVDDTLEDVAGNNFRDVLDREVGHR